MKIFLASIFFIFSIFANDSKAQNEFNFDFDYAKFNQDSNHVILEFYYSFNQNDLTILKDDRGLFSEAVLHIEIIDLDSNIVLIDKEWKVQNNLTDTSETSLNKNLIGTLAYIIRKGNFKVIAGGFDAIDSLNRKFYEETISIVPFATDRCLVSDIQLASNIIRENANSNSIFYKNSYEVTPNPLNVYTEILPVRLYYAELYNLADDSSSTPLRLFKQIVNSKGLVLAASEKSIPRNNNSIVEVGTFNLSKYPTDSYNIILSLIDTLSKSGVSSTKRFFVYNPNIKDTINVVKGNFDLLSSEFGIMSDEECDEMFAGIKYIASDKEIDQYDKLDSLTAKQEYLLNFWRIRDSEPSTPENEFKIEYSKRLKEANDKFKSFSKPGFKSDRGRILLTYGNPDEIERHPNDTDKKPYEIWYYNAIEGGVVFVFGDISGYGDFELLHSNKRGELRDDNWIRRITAN